MAVYLARLREELLRARIPCAVIGFSLRKDRAGLKRDANRVLNYLSVAVRLIGTPGRAVICFSGSELNLAVNGLIVWWAKALGKKVVLRLSGGKFKDSLRTARSVKKKWLSSVFFVTDRIVINSLEIMDGLAYYGIPASKIVFLSNALPFDENNLRDTAKLDERDRELFGFMESHFPLGICIGGTDAMYGSELLLRAFARFRAEFLRAGLILVLKSGSRAGDFEGILALVKDLVLGTSVYVLRDLPRNQVLALFQRSHFLVRPSYYDGDSNAVREGLALGLPVLASDAAPRPGGVFLFRTGDLESLVGAMSALAGGITAEKETDKDRIPAISGYEGRENLGRIAEVLSSLMRNDS